MSLFRTLKIVSHALTVLDLTEGVIDMTDNHTSDAPREENEERATPPLIEEIEVEARELVARVRQLIREGNVRTLRIKDGKGRYLLEVPLTVGVLVGGVFALTAPALTALTAVLGLATKVKIEIERRPEDGDDAK